MIDDPTRARALLDARARDVAQAEKERRRLRVFPVVAVVAGVLALPFHRTAAAGLFATFLAFWAVGHYLNYFHRRDMAQKLADARRALESPPS